MSDDMELVITQDDLSDGNIIRILKVHRTEMLKHSPPESVHALDEAQLRAPEITFWSARFRSRDCDEFAGCGALKDLGDGHGELKSMKTELASLRKGVAQGLLQHIIEYALANKFSQLSLETGTQEVFGPARALYHRNGFRVCAPFSDYQEDPVSVCMTLALA